MPRLPERCISCGGNLRVAASSVVTRYYDLNKLDLDTMAALVGKSTTREHYSEPSYAVVCMNCGDSQSVTVKFSETTQGAYP